MTRNRAAYMRAYRANRANSKPTMTYEEAMVLTTPPGVTIIADEHLTRLAQTISDQNVKIADLEAEIAHLKRELAARPISTRSALPDDGRAYREYRPAPKPGSKR